MRVIHISDNLMSGAPYRLAQIQRRAGVEARVVNRLPYTNEGPRRREYPHDLLNDAPESVLRPVFEAADIVHYHQQWKEGQLFEAHPWARAVLHPKPSLIQFHVPRTDRMEPVLRDSRVVKLVVAQYHVRLYPECQPIPNAVPIDDDLHRPSGASNQPPLIAFTPPDCTSGGWWNKGCAATRAVLEGGFRHVVVTDRSWREGDGDAARLRRRDRRGGDRKLSHVLLGSTLPGRGHRRRARRPDGGRAGVRDRDARTSLGRRAARHAPRAAPELVSDPDFLRAKREAARAYMVRYWNPSLVAARYRAVYEQVLERHGG